MGVVWAYCKLEIGSQNVEVGEIFAWKIFQPKHLMKNSSGLPPFTKHFYSTFEMELFFALCARLTCNRSKNLMCFFLFVSRGNWKRIPKTCKSLKLRFFQLWKSQIFTTNVTVFEVTLWQHTHTRAHSPTHSSKSLLVVIIKKGNGKIQNDELLTNLNLFFYGKENKPKHFVCDRSSSIFHGLVIQKKAR